MLSGRRNLAPEFAHHVPKHDIFAPQMRRQLNWLDLTLIGVGASIGAGIFVFTGVAARDAGPGVVISFGLAACACALDALCYAELATKFPYSGSAYLYAREAFGPQIALITGANLLFDYAVGAAAIARSLTAYGVQLCRDLHLLKTAADVAPSVTEFVPFPEDWPWLSFSLIAPLLLLAITAVLCLGIKETRTANNLLTLTKIGIIAVIIVVGLPHTQAANLRPFIPFGGAAIGHTAAMLFFAYVGFDAVSNAAEECIAPSRDLPIGTRVQFAAHGIYCTSCTNAMLHG